MARAPQNLRSYELLTALSGASAVGLGAFGAHGLRHLVSPEHLAVWRTAVEYQLFHTVALLVLIHSSKGPQPLWTLRLWTLGILLFSGSLYALVLTQVRVLGAITPLGGLSFIAGWLALVFTARSRRKAPSE